MDSEQNLVLLCPEAVVAFSEDKLHMIEKIPLDEDEEKCKVSIQDIDIFHQEGRTKYLHCKECHGKGHEELEKTRPIEHPLHPKHPLILARVEIGFISRKCYCCARFILTHIYCCPKCDFIMNIGCVKKPAVFTIEHPKRHRHMLTLFPRQDSITCNVCALDQSSYPIYMCRPPCDFVVHKSCIGLPWVIRISRHHHRISFTPSFVLEDLLCRICRRKLDSNYGGYSCKKEGCSYVTHSRCATRTNVWDGKELEGEQEDVEEEVEPFERISDGIIRHFCHENHHLILDEDTDRVYDESKYCHICNTPIYYGNLYSCLQCDFILHETCTNLPRTKYHAIHPHVLTLVVQAHVRRTFSYDACSACHQICDGFFYQCGKERCLFKLHVQCATISEPLIHESHMHPLFLTSGPEERRSCSVCKEKMNNYLGSNDTFNCIECEFALCFRCAVLPQKVSYKHDKHILTLSYGEETSAIKIWCEICETSIDPCKRFYTCEDCCVTLHIGCLVGTKLFMKPGSYVLTTAEKFDALLNSRMSQPMCKQCQKRCQDNLIFQFKGLTFCPGKCFWKVIVDDLEASEGENSS